MRRVSQQEWENEHMHNPMTEGEALAVLRELRDTGDVSDWQAMESALTMAIDRLTAHTAALREQPVQEGGGARLTNPWTGEPRDYRDVNSDPAGTLCVEPGAPLKAAPPSAPVGVDLVELGRLLVREREAVGGAFTPDWLLFREALTQQPAQAAPGDDEYRLLLRGDVVQAGDEVLHDNCTRWIELAGWEIGMVYDPLVFVPVRRKAPTPPGDDAAGGGFDDPAFSSSANPYEEPRS